MEIRIAKKLCETVKTIFQDGYYVTMLPTSKYAGYRFYVSNYYCYSRSGFVGIIESENEEYRFTLEKVDREPGKRYRRPKLSFEELRAEFEEHSAQFDPNALPQALAYVKIYANNGSRNAGEVIGSCICVGGIDNTWFYEADGRRRRLNTHGVRILKALTQDEAKEINAKLSRLEELGDMERRFKNCLIEYRKDYFFSAMQQVLTSDKVGIITAKLDEINSIIENEATECRREVEELREYFNAFLEDAPDGAVAQ